MPAVPFRLVCPGAVRSVHKEGTARRKPSRESVCNSYGNFFDRFLGGILLYAGVSVHSFDCYGTFKVHIGRLLPIGRTEYLAFAEHYYVVGKRVSTERAASVVLLNSNILVDNYDL